MKLLKKLALAAAVAAVASSASAGMKPIADAELSKVSGQDGVSIAADLKINIGNFTYTNTAADGGSVSFNNIKFNGTIAATLDVISAAAFAGPTGQAFSVLGLNPTAANTQANLAGFYAGGDVVKIAIPDLDVTSAHNLNMSVDSIKMGGSSASFGKMALNDIRLQGTTVYIWAH